MAGCPIRKSADQFVCADPRGLSQLVASFVASGRLGIPRVPLFTFFRPLPLLPSYGLPSVNIWPKQYKNFLCPHCLSSFLYQHVTELYLCRSTVLSAENKRVEPLNPCIE